MGHYFKYLNIYYNFKFLIHNLSKIMLSRFASTVLKTPTFYNARYFSQVISSVPGNKPPVTEETVAGRYAGVLFKIASQNEVLDKVADDMEMLNSVATQSTSVSNFLSNSSSTRSEQLAVFEAVYPQLNQITVQFLDVLIDNKRTNALEKITETYTRYVKMLNKQESVRVVSATELNEGQKSQLLDALKVQYEGVTFTMNYDVNPAIMGGLQIYTGNRFLDCSLVSRVNFVRNELNKMYA